MNQTFVARWPGRLVGMACLGLLLVMPVIGSTAASSLDLLNRPALGAEAAPVTVVEVSSFKCTHCRNFHQQVFPKLRARYIDTGLVHWVVLNASDDPADEYARIFSVARCVQRQGKYWELLDELFRVGPRPSTFVDDAIAGQDQINREDLLLCIRDRAIRAEVAKDFADYAQLKLKGTPSFIISKIGRDGQRIETVIAGAEKLAYFERVIDELLKMP